MKTDTLLDPDILAARILLVDDERANLVLMDRMLRAARYTNLELIQDPRELMPAYQAQPIDLILLDIRMPHLSGFDILDELAARDDPMVAPVMVLSAEYNRDAVLRALHAGARDFIGKPIDRAEVLAKVRNMLEVRLAHRLAHNQRLLLERLVAERTTQLRETRLQVVHRLGRAAEYRDNETGDHILRMSHVSALLARHLGWDDARCECMLHASPMHDVGKIGIPDSILLKPAKLTPDEWAIMQAHTSIGGAILDGDDSDLLHMAREIALAHHEKWDGSGYPGGLAGEEIPHSGRIVAIADVFDALTSARPYKAPWPLEQALDTIREGANQHFDPRIVEAFFDLLPQILEIRARFSEVDGGIHPGPDS